ncbi:hypothetical protein [Streptomyces sp. NPDC097619]|uniref:hypothetical protein n=1 Tax=Streptomyces sp. NPDC097619 TaxID=3157228 RepID=UPI00332A0153
MIAHLKTWWTVGVDNFAADCGCAEAEVPRELSWYVSASINDIKALNEADGWAHGHGESLLRVTGGRVHMAAAWRLEVDRAAWAAARGQDPRTALRADFAQHIAQELIGLPSVCETDAVMTAEFATGRGPVRRTWTWQDRHPHAKTEGPPIHLPAVPGRAPRKVR